MQIFIDDLLRRITVPGHRRNQRRRRPRQSDPRNGRQRRLRKPVVANEPVSSGIKNSYPVPAMLLCWRYFIDASGRMERRSVSCVIAAH